MAARAALTVSPWQQCQHDCGRLDQSIGSLGIGSYVSWWEPAESSEESTEFTQSPTEHTGTSSLDADITRLTTQPDLAKADLTLNINAAASLNDTDNPEPYTPTTERGGTPRPDTPKASGLNSIPTVSAPPAATPAADANAEAPAGPQFGVQNRFFPLSTATLETSVFDVVHVFSERGISAVPIVDADGVVLNMYETVDIVDLVRQKGYDILHSTIAVALSQRAPDFGGVITCSPKDTLASILAYIRERRVHRIVIVEDEDVPADGNRAARKKGALVGILSLSDVLRFLVGHENLKGLEVPGLGQYTSHMSCAQRDAHTDACLDFLCRRARPPRRDQRPPRPGHRHGRHLARRHRHGRQQDGQPARQRGERDERGGCDQGKGEECGRGERAATARSGDVA